MSAPPLPDPFGNYALGDFVEVVSPGDISWLPQTAGWAWLAVALALLLLRVLWRWLHRWYRNRYRREAIARLKKLAQSTDHDALLMELNKLLKLTAMAAFSRERVARLSGEEWIDFLDRQCRSPVFSKEQRSLLALGTYKTTPIAKEQQQQMVAACRDWIRLHERPEHA